MSMSKLLFNGEIYLSVITFLLFDLDIISFFFSSEYVYMFSLIFL